MKIGLAVVAVLGVVALGALGARAMDYRHHGGWHGAFMGHRGGHGLGAVCAGRTAERIERMNGLVDRFNGFSAPQAASWEGLKRAMAEAETGLRRACDKAAEGRATVPGRLAGLETTLAAASRALSKVRPAVDAFYETLDDGQRAALDGILGGHRHR